MNKQTNQSTIINTVLMVILIIAISFPRLFAIDKTITVDEVTWLSMGSDFYYALGQREFSKTVYEAHPGVTTMVAASLAVHTLFPEYRGLGQGYFNIGHISHDLMGTVKFYEDHNVDMHAVITRAKTFMVLGIIISLIILFYLSKNLFGFNLSFFGVLFIALDPYHIGHSRQLTQDALMSNYAIVSLFAWLNYRKDKKSVYLIISSVAAAIAFLTKITSFYLVGFIALIELIMYFVENKQKFSQIIFSLLKWGGLILVFVFILWPAMWVDPLKSLIHPFITSPERWFKSESIALFSPEYFSTHLDVLSTFSLSLLGRTTLVTWLGFILFILFFVIKKKFIIAKKDNYLYLSILIFPFLFLLMFSMVSKSTYAHYIIMTHIFVSYLGGVGFGFMLNYLWKKYPTQNMRTLYILLIGCLVFFQVVEISKQYPYYFTYRNQLISKSVYLNGYCAVLDQAGYYLSEKPDAENQTTLSWYGPGCFSFFYKGKMLPLWPQSDWGQSNIDKLLRSDYLVLYHSSFNREGLKYFTNLVKTVEPEKIISFQGNDFVWIYKVEDLPPEVYLVPNN